MKTQPPASQRSSRFLWLGVVIFCLFAGSYIARSYFSPAPKSTSPSPAEDRQYQRIVALAPSIVEIVYELGIDDRLVGVSRFCKHPAEVIEKPVVGGFLDLHFEALLRLAPDCVILLEEQQSVAQKLTELGIDSITLDHASTEGIIDSIAILGECFSSKQRAQSIRNQIETRINKVKAAQPNKKPTVLVCIGRDTSAQTPSSITAAGNKGVHQEYITMAGGTNAYQGAIAYPVLSREKLIHLDADIIIDLISEETWQAQGEATLLQQWQNYGELSAVKSQSILFLRENKHMIPGPRFVDTLETFSQFIKSYGQE